MMSAMTSRTVQPSEAPATDGRVALAALVTVTCWASAFIGIRFAGPHFSPGSLALLRMTVGAVFLGLITARLGLHLPRGKDLALTVVWGIAWFCFYNLALNQAERLIDAGTAAMVVNLAPLMVVLLAGLLLHEGFPPGLVVGAPVSFAGVVLIGSQRSGGHVQLGGLLLALAAAVLYAGSTLLQKHLLRTVDSAILTFVGAVASVVALLPWPLSSP